MQKFTYCVPTKVVFGPGTEDEAGREVRTFGGTHVLVLYGGGSAVKSGLIGRVTAALEAEGLAHTLRGGVQPNPTLEYVNETLAAVQGLGVDFVLAVGGGSVIDAAKTLSFGLATPAVNVWDYMIGRAKPTAALPIGCVLTISAAGSETSDSCVITNESTHEKRGCNTDFNRPRFAIMNPELTYTLPRYQTACGAADILMHTMERYFSCDGGNELTDAMAEALMRTVIRAASVALAKADDYDAQSELMWAGSLSHNNLTGLGRAKDFSVHQFGHELSGRYGIAHGASLTILWPAWAKAVCATDFHRFARFARNVWGVTESNDRTAAFSGIAEAERFFRSMDLPVTLGGSEVGVLSEEALDALALGCSRNKSRMLGCFCPMDHDGIRRVYASVNR